MFRAKVFVIFYFVVKVRSDCFHLNVTGGVQREHDIFKYGTEFEEEMYTSENYTLWGCICEEKCRQKWWANSEFAFEDLCIEGSDAFTTELVGYNQTNEICIKGDQIMEEYLWNMLKNESFGVERKTLDFDDICLDNFLLGHMTVFKCTFEMGAMQDNSTPEGVLNMTDQEDHCDEEFCVRKCCGPDQVFSINKMCVRKDDPSRSLEALLEKINFTRVTHHLIYSELDCDNDSYRFPTSEFQLNDRGSINWEGGEVDTDKYCIEAIYNEKEEFSLKALICEVEDNEEIAENLHYTGMIISMPFLLATFLVYALLPESNLHRRALMSYVLTLLLAYIILVGVQLSGEIPPLGCHLLGYSIVFFFTVSFFWMNVMCIDMWLTFRGMRGYGGRKKAERKRFIIYSIYAWGMPLLHVLMVFLLNTYGDESSPFHPALGAQRCFVGEGLPNFLYFYCLTMIIIIINIILFMLTGIKIYQVKKDTSMLKHSDSNKHSYEDDKQQFKLYVKLLFAMGINWVTEIISWAIAYFWQETPEALFYLTDFVNATYGVFIFFIFVFKRKIWKSLKKRYYICIGKPHLAQVMSTTRNRTSNYSTTATTDTGVNMTEMRNGKEEERALNRI